MLHSDQIDVGLNSLAPTDFGHGSFVAGHGDAPVEIPDAALMFSGGYERSGQDLVISRPLESITIHGYFAGAERAALVAPGGATLDAATVLALTHDASRMRLAGEPPAAPSIKAIGRVETLSGTATAMRNGQSVTLHVGDLVFKGDAVQTDDHGALAITFIDGTAFNLSANARMVLDDMVYAPDGTSNSALLSLVQGSISFIAGGVAHTGDMKIDTPVATMGIRGTAVHVDIDAHHGKTRFSVMREKNGRVGKFVLLDKHDHHVIGTVDDVGIALVLDYEDGKVLISSVPKTALDLQNETLSVDQVFQAFQTGQQNPLLPQLQQMQTEHGPITHGSSGSPNPSGSGLPSPIIPPPPTPDAPSTPTAPIGPGGPPFAGGPSSGPANPTPIVPVATPPQTTTGTPTIAFAAPTDALTATKASATDTPTISVLKDDPVTVETTGWTASGGVFTKIGTYGIATLDPTTGAVTYTLTSTPPAGTSTAESFVVTVVDSHGVTATATATFEADGSPTIVFAAPTSSLTATSAGVTDTPTISLLTNDAVTVETTGWTSSGGIFTKIGTFGTATLDPATGAVTYMPTSQPPAGTSTAESFAVTVVDSHGVAETANATFEVDGAPTIFFAAPTSSLAATGASATETPTISVLSDDAVTVETTGWTSSGGIFTKIGTFGTATLDPASGAVTYTLTSTPPAGTSTAETFDVTVVDSHGVTATTASTFEVDGGPTIFFPTSTTTVTAASASATDTPIISVLTNDAVTVETADWVNSGGIFTKTGTYGTATLDATTGAVTYTLTSTPPAGTSTVESFAVTVVDSHGTTATNDATFEIDGAPTISSAAPISGLSAIGTSATDAPTISVLTDDTVTVETIGWTDSGGVFTKAGTYGTATLDPTTGAVTYTLTSTSPAGLSATESFAVAVVDSHGVTATANATFEIDGAPTIVFAAPTSAITSLSTSATDTPTISALTDDTVTVETVGWTDSGGVFTKTGTYGTATLDPTTGAVTYTLTSTPPAGTSTAESFAVAVVDSHGAIAAADATFEVDGAPTIAFAAPTSAVTSASPSAQDSPTISGLIDDAVTVETIGWADSGGVFTKTGTYGTATLDPTTGAVTYTLTSTPPAGGSAAESFAVTVVDSQGVTATANVTFEVDGAPTIAFATPTSAVTSASTSATDTPSISVLTDDAVTVETADWTSSGGGFTKTGTYGTATLDPTTGAVTYALTSTPPAGTSTVESFAVTVVDSHSTTATNDATFEVDGAPTISFASPTSDLSAIGISATDAPTISVLTDDTVTVETTGWTSSGGVFTKAGTYGTATLDPTTGAVTYTLTSTPPAGLSATESFAVAVVDSHGVTATTNATFEIDGAPTIVFAAPTSAITSLSTSATDIPTISALTDDDVTVETIGWADSGGVFTKIGTYGTATLDPTTGAVTYTLTSTPPAGTSTAESFAVAVVDSHGVVATANATFEVDGAPTIAFAAPTSALTAANTSATDMPTISVLTDDPVIVETIGWTSSGGVFTKTGTYGTATLNATTGAVTYVATSTPPAGLSATESFAVAVVDSHGVTATTNATFEIDGAPTIVFAAPTSATTSFSTSATDTPTISALTDDDVTVETMGWTDSGGVFTKTGTYGTATLDPTSGAVTYTLTSTPPACTSTAESFAVTVVDSHGVTAAANATFEIDGAPTIGFDAPTSAITSLNTSATDTPTISALTDDNVTVETMGWTDSGGVFTKTGTYGTATLDATTGAVTYTLTSTPPAGTSATESFAVAVVDSHSVEATANATFEVDGAPTIAFAAPTSPLTSVSTSATDMPTISVLTDDPVNVETTGWTSSGGVFTKAGTYGTATLDPTTGAVTYTLTSTPPAGTSAAESFGVTVVDSHGIFATANAVFEVDGPATVSPPANLPTNPFTPQTPQSYMTFHGQTQDEYLATSSVLSSQTGNVTIAASFEWSGSGKSSTGAGQLIFYEGGDTSSNGFGLYGLIENGRMELEVLTGGRQILDTGVSVAAGTWHEVALTYNAQGQASLYLDGTSDTLAGAVVPTTPVGGFEIGGNPGNGAEGFPGSIADVSVWNTALSTAQLNALAVDDSDAPTSGLVAYFPLNGVLADTSGTHTLTVAGNPTLNYTAPSFTFTTSTSVAATVTGSSGGFTLHDGGDALSGIAPFSLASVEASSSTGGAVTINGYLDGSLVATETVTLPVANGSNVSNILLGPSFGDVDAVQLVGVTGVAVAATNYAVNPAGEVENVAVLSTQATDLDILANILASIPAGDTIAVSTASAQGATVSIENGLIVYDPHSSATLQALMPGVSAKDTFTYTVENHGAALGGPVTVALTVQDPAIVTSAIRQLAVSDALVSLPKQSVHDAASTTVGTPEGHGSGHMLRQSHLANAKAVVDHAGSAGTAGSHFVSFGAGSTMAQRPIGGLDPDHLVAGTVHHVLTGERDADTFVFKTNIGHDGTAGSHVDAAQPQALAELWAHMSNLHEVMAAVAITDGTTVVHDGHGLTLDHVSVADLSTNFFHL